MKVALYARVSTSDKDQDPETQLVQLREFLQAQRWLSFNEYVDYAPATDLLHRFQWRQLLDDASKHKFDLLLVWRMDRAFRSVLNVAAPLVGILADLLCSALAWEEEARAATSTRWLWPKLGDLYTLGYTLSSSREHAPRIQNLGRRHCQWFL